MKAIKDLQKLIYEKGPTFLPIVSPYSFTLYNAAREEHPGGHRLERALFVNTWYLDS